ncbi:FHA domain-containing protein [Actinosynnema sp. NPDC020468]|uniref:FHA domain-containing protein n=1 Tax=Actinosynnema sp. NPDC020468 TaxID=3154488 RepID=UPI0033F3DED8
MARCPAGHDSTTDDYCDVCGAPMEAPPPAPRAHDCAACGAVRVGRFCEECGHDSLTPPPAAPPQALSWHVSVEADRAYFERVLAVDGPDASAVGFPEFCPPRRFELSGQRVSIGRRSRSRGLVPDVDLTGPPEDPGVSHSHALLVASAGGWSVVDLGSTNGTTVNEGEDPLRPNVPRPLADGDRVHLGAWTTLTLRRG